MRLCIECISKWSRLNSTVEYSTKLLYYFIRLMNWNYVNLLGFQVVDTQFNQNYLNYLGKDRGTGGTMFVVIKNVSFY